MMIYRSWRLGENTISVVVYWRGRVVSYLPFSRKNDQWIVKKFVENCSSYWGSFGSDFFVSFILLKKKMISRSSKKIESHLSLEALLGGVSRESEVLFSTTKMITIEKMWYIIVFYSKIDIFSHSLMTSSPFTQKLIPVIFY